MNATIAPPDAAGTCQNCATPLRGEYCHACGQSAHNPLRSLRHAIEDVFESFWHLDGRVFRTLRDLLAPGRVALNYLAGQRVRYVAPLRLFVVLSVLAFFVAQQLVDIEGGGTRREVPAAADEARVEPGDDEGLDRILAATTIAEVERLRAAQLQELARARNAVALVPIARQGIDRAVAKVERTADRRIAALAAREGLSAAQVTAARVAQRAPTLETATTLAELERLRAARIEALRARLAAVAAADTAARNRLLGMIRQTNHAAGCRAAQLEIERAEHSERPLRPQSAENLAIYGDPDCDRDLSFNGEPWDPEINPLRLERAPAAVNRWINALVARGEANIARLQKEPALYVRALLGAVPGALFLLVPVFALLLKLAYLGSGRAYLEHFTVALYSHAFLSLALLALCGLIALGNALAPYGAGVRWISGGLQALLWLWLPVYLLWTQKRVYGDGWPLTLLRYLLVGLLYCVLLGCAITVVALTSLVWM
ncbi:MAG TPA: DUF3667 domain-containing protein [Lysobacter sp.]|nr:DUF3667 domain-containing protein [Lysobacter sp.]